MFRSSLKLVVSHERKHPRGYAQCTRVGTDTEMPLAHFSYVPSPALQASELLQLYHTQHTSGKQNFPAAASLPHLYPSRTHTLPSACDILYIQAIELGRGMTDTTRKSLLFPCLNQKRMLRLRQRPAEIRSLRIWNGLHRQILIHFNELR